MRASAGAAARGVRAGGGAGAVGGVRLVLPTPAEAAPSHNGASGSPGAIGFPLGEPFATSFTH